MRTDRPVTEYGRGSGVPHPIDVQVGARVRLRRLLIGMSQESLAASLGLTFQQIQKYERGHNRISASRLVATAAALGVPVAYFFAALELSAATLSPEEQRWRELHHQPETIDLVRHYYAIPDPQVREQFLVMVKAIAQSSLLASTTQAEHRPAFRTRIRRTGQGEFHAMSITPERG